MLQIKMKTKNDLIDKNWFVTEWRKTNIILRRFMSLNYEERKLNKSTTREITLKFSIPAIESDARKGDVSQDLRKTQIEIDFYNNLVKKLPKDVMITDVDYINDPYLDINKKASKSEVKTFKRIFKKYLKK